jgi:type I restriction enzyme S subunit
MQQARQKVRLPQVAFFQEGPGLRNWQWRDTGIKAINGTNIRSDGTFDPSNTDKYVSWSEFSEKYKHFAIEPGDIVVSIPGPSVRLPASARSIYQ